MCKSWGSTKILCSHPRPWPITAYGRVHNKKGPFQTKLILRKDNCYLITALCIRLVFIQPQLYTYLHFNSQHIFSHDTDFLQRVVDNMVSPGELRIVDGCSTFLLAHLWSFCPPKRASFSNLVIGSQRCWVCCRTCELQWSAINPHINSHFHTAITSDQIFWGDLEFSFFETFCQRFSFKHRSGTVFHQ